jgi:hypothetical protein
MEQHRREREEERRLQAEAREHDQGILVGLAQQIEAFQETFGKKMEAAIMEEVQAREAAISQEVQAREAAIESAISHEVQARESAITEEARTRQMAISDLARTTQQEVGRVH